MTMPLPFAVLLCGFAVIGAFAVGFLLLAVLVTGGGRRRRSQI